MLSSEEAGELIRLGRLAVLRSLEGKELQVPEDLKEKFSRKRGVFTTLLTYPSKSLRGVCWCSPSGLPPLACRDPLLPERSL